MTKVAEKFSVSGSYMARVCSVLRVPRPEPGYWAKLNVGKAPARPALPEALPGDQLIWSQNGDLPLTTRGVAITSSNPLASRARRIVTGTHGLVRDAKQHYERGYKVEDGQLLRPYKRMLVDVVASLAGLDKALSFANDNIWRRCRCRCIGGPPVQLRQDCSLNRSKGPAPHRLLS